MATEVKRTNWSRFCKRFNSLNQYRPVTVRVKHKGTDEIEVSHEDPLIGIALTKRGRLIDGVNLYTTQTDPDKLAEPAVTIKEPVKITADKDDTKKDVRLAIESKGGTTVRIELSRDENTDRLHSTLEKLAYTLYERRGHTCGRDVDDWLEAERLITQTASTLT